MIEKNGVIGGLNLPKEAEHSKSMHLCSKVTTTDPTPDRLTYLCHVVFQ